MSEAPGAARAPWPLRISRHKSDGSLSVTFDTGEVWRLPGPYLRAASPAASERGHGARAQRRDPLDFAGVRVLEARPVGAYAVRLVFTDGHDTGLYTYESLYDLCLSAQGAAERASPTGGGGES